MSQETEPAGRVVWHDLMTRDAVQAKAFYEGVFGWDIQGVEANGQTSDMIHLAGVRMGGVVPLEAPEGVPSHWIAYVRTDDINACLSRVESSGGQICVPATRMALGTFAVITDPQGGVISPLQVDEPEPHPSMETPGAFSWNELHSSDPAASKAFYGEVFGWEFKAHDMGEMGTYHLIHMAGLECGGIMQLPAEASAGGAPTAWMPYVTVTDVDATHAKAVELGASTFVPPMEIPDVGRFSVVADPSGGTFAIYKDVSHK